MKAAHFINQYYLLITIKMPDMFTPLLRSLFVLNLFQTSIYARGNERICYITRAGVSLGLHFVCLSSNSNNNDSLRFGDKALATSLKLQSSVYCAFKSKHEAATVSDRR